jgi:hypothetical protein
VNDSKVTRFPIRGDQRWKNRLGKRATACIVTMRWLQFPEKSEALADGHFMFVDVMTSTDGKDARKLCQLCISKEDLLPALGEVDK